ncbi:MAG: hypothetical protein FWB80_04695 [Defluviitaleaceae bacterium]|nr:hypothetical protein [Defluviitaleaceae bacterium]
MKKAFLIVTIFCLLLVFFVGCEYEHEQNEPRTTENTDMEIINMVDLGCCVKNIVVRETALIGANSVTYTGNYFIITLNSDKKVYSPTDIISIWGTLEYIGENDSIEIWHGCPFIHFLVEGGIFNFGGGQRDILASSVLQRNRVYHFDFHKSGGWSADAPDAEFWENFFREENLILPAGEYTITIKGAFGLTERVPDNPSGLMAKLTIIVCF